MKPRVKFVLENMDSNLSLEVVKDDGAIIKKMDLKVSGIVNDTVKLLLNDNVELKPEDEYFFNIYLVNDDTGNKLAVDDFPYRAKKNRTCIFQKEFMTIEFEPDEAASFLKK